MSRDLSKETQRQAGLEALATLIRGLAVGFGFVAVMGLAVDATSWASPVCAVASIVCLVVAHKVANS
jgi:hypothetical protein